MKVQSECAKLVCNASVQNECTKLGAKIVCKVRMQDEGAK